MCRFVSCVVDRGCLLWPMHSIGNSLLGFALLHFVLHGQTCLLLQVSLDFLLLHSSPLWWKGHLCVCVCVCVCVCARSKISCRSSQNCLTSASSALVAGGMGLDYCDVGMFPFEMNQDHSVVFEISPKCCISAWKRAW